jgi:hypothetical protein
MNTLRKFLYSTLAVLVLVSFVGCDSDDEDDPADVFVGTWALTGIEDDTGDLTAALQQTVNSLTIVFEEDRDYVLNLDYNEVAEAAGQTDVTLSGTYSATETQLNLVVPDLGVTLPLNYTVVNNDQIELSGQAALINQIFGVNTYQGTVTITVTRQ